MPSPGSGSGAVGPVAAVSAVGPVASGSSSSPPPAAATTAMTANTARSRIHFFFLMPPPSPRIPLGLPPSAGTRSDVPGDARPPMGNLPRSRIPRCGPTGSLSRGPMVLSLRSEQAVPEVTEPGKDVPVLVQLPVQGGREDRHVRVVRLHLRDALWGGDHADERERGRTPLLPRGRRGQPEPPVASIGS